MNQNIERNDESIDGYTWDQWVAETIRQNSLGFSIISSPDIANVSTSSEKRKKIRRKETLNSCLNL